MVGFLSAATVVSQRPSQGHSSFASVRLPVAIWSLASRIGSPAREPVVAALNRLRFLNGIICRGAMGMTLSDRQIQYFRVLCMAVLLAGAASYVVFTIHWRWMWDTQVMHYIVLLLKHGKVPYKDIYDI